MTQTKERCGYCADGAGGLRCTKRAWRNGRCKGHQHITGGLRRNHICPSCKGERFLFDFAQDEAGMYPCDECHGAGRVVLTAVRTL